MPTQPPAYSQPAFRNDLHTLFTQLELDAQMQTTFFNEACVALDNLYLGYNLKDLQLQMQGCSQLYTINNSINCIRYGLYVRDNATAIALRIRHCVSCASSKLVAEEVIDLFICKGLQNFFDLFLIKLQEMESDLNDVFMQLARVIAIRFANSVLLYDKPNGYTSFYMNLCTYLKILGDEITDKVDPNSFMDIATAYAPGPYKKANDVVDMVHPLNTIQYVHQQMLKDFDSKYDHEQTLKLLLQIRPGIAQHKQILEQIHRPRWASKICRANFVFNVQLLDNIFAKDLDVFADAYLREWLEKKGYSEMEDILLDFDDERVIRKASYNLRLKLAIASEQYLKAPVLSAVDPSSTVLSEAKLANTKSDLNNTNLPDPASNLHRRNPRPAVKG